MLWRTDVDGSRLGMAPADDPAAGYPAGVVPGERPPQILAPALVTATEDTAAPIAGVSVSDPENDVLDV